MRSPALTKAHPGGPSDRFRDTTISRDTGVVSDLPMFVGRDCGEDPRRVQLLAMHEVRRGLERFAVAGTAAWCGPVGLNQTPLVGDLLELIAALDRRVPRAERAGESSIARDAAALKTRALQRVAELERGSAATDPR